MKQLLLAVLYGILGFVAGGIAVYILTMQAGPDLAPWHLVELDEEFTADDKDRITDLDGYRDMEDRLFQQLKDEVYGDDPETDPIFNRFHRGSWSDPFEFEINWNRTFEFVPDSPKFGVLMLHGLSDSPYSLRALSEGLYERGARVVGLRLPGHGTAPSGLDRVKWQDLTTAARLAARDLCQKIGPDRPFYITGYSNGASLALEYTLSVLEGEDLRMPDGLILLSPAVGITPVAALAKWNLRMSYLPWLEKMGWNSIQPEFDPYKYNSFAINAGDQIYRLLRGVTARMKRLDPSGKGIKNFPPVLAFQSVADATVVTDAVVKNLMQRLAPDNHHLVLFDVNRISGAADFFARDTSSLIESLFKAPLPFDLTLITNKDPSSRKVVARHKPTESDSEEVERTGLSWPREVYSLSHVAIPFSPEDPVYGLRSEEEGRLLTLGSLEPRGERALLQVPVESLMRLRYNPFYSYVEETVFERLGARVENAQRAHSSHLP